MSGETDQTLLFVRRHGIGRATKVIDPPGLDFDEDNRAIFFRDNIQLPIGKPDIASYNTISVLAKILFRSDFGFLAKDLRLRCHTSS